ncbi:MAG: Type 1 glutamine amidotransferase-like domain-containing protein [Candidatus Aenigmarchaeota archaeon]|nr:Type 1 glutamine amidotransferase-like domain-containing protein [Candidatus Aenigmarchaeota archaeon]
MRLFLTSSGLRKEYEKDFLKLLNKPAKETKVAFIPTAADPEKDKSFVQKSINELRKVGITQIEEVDLKIENEKSLKEKLSKVDVIYVNGGNTFYLLNWVRKSGFDKLLPKLLKKGKIYFGTSAGSYIACPTIEMANWKCQDSNRIEMQDFSALNLVPFLITAHYTEDYRKILKKEAKKTKYTVIALNDLQAIVFIDAKYEIVGKDPKLLFNR